MARIEYKFSKEEIELIGLGKSQHVFNESTDYIRLNVFGVEDGEETDLLYSFASNRPLLKDSAGKFYFGHYHYIDNEFRKGIRYDEDDYQDGLQELLTRVSNTQLKIYFDKTSQRQDNFYIKPNEVLDKAGLTEGNYILKIDSFKNVFDCDIPNTSTELGPKGQQTRLQVKQIGSSRKEVRLVITDSQNPSLNFDSIRGHLTEAMGNPESDKEIVSESGELVANPNYNPYKFDFSLSILNEGISIPILNFLFDDTGKGETTLLIKLNGELPLEITEYDNVKIGRQLSSTVVEDIYFVSTVEQIVRPVSLPYDVSMLENIGTDDTVDLFQTYDQVTASVSNTGIIEDIVTGSDTNLNLDFGQFDNHVFFGSAVRKLENFKSKVGEIEGHYNLLSESLQQFHYTASTFELGHQLLEPTSASFEGYGDTSDISGSYFYPRKMVETGSRETNGNTFLILQNTGSQGNRRFTKQAVTTEGMAFTDLETSQSYFVSFKLKNISMSSSLDPFSIFRNNPIYWKNFKQITNPPVSTTDWKEYSFTAIHSSDATPNDGFSIFAFTGNQTGSESSSIAIDDINIQKLYNRKSPKSTIQHREYLFKKIKNVVGTFTPYEKYLYYGEGTSSSPSLGKNYTNHRVVKKRDKTSTINKFDGFDVVYKISGSDNLGSGAEETMGLFDSLYKVEDAPFFNSTSSFYLSFLMKGTEQDTPIYRNYNTSSHPKLPHDVMNIDTIEAPAVVEDGYKRYIYKASASYWRPVSGIGSVGFPGGIVAFEEGSTDVELLQGANVTGSFPIQTAGKYQYLSTVNTQSGEPFSGSMLPAGELFNIKLENLDGNITSSYITDVKISTQNPTGSKPFASQINTGSAEWTDWYDALYTSASNYDTSNIHSLANNLPSFIISDCTDDHSVMLKFVDMLGEYYDLLRSYIDNYKSFVKPGFSGTDIAPDNVLSVLAADKDWEFILPFTGSLVEHLGGDYFKADKTKDTVDNTFRKIYQSIIGIYKSKGSLKGIRSLLNSYGVPPEVMKLREHGGSMTAHDTSVLTGDTSNLLDGVSMASGNVSYQEQTDTMYSYMFNDDDNRTLKFDWHMNDAGIYDETGSSGAECVEFLMKPARGNNSQSILKSSGSEGIGLWDLQLLPSASIGDKEYGKLQFTLMHSTSSTLRQGGVETSTMETPTLGFKNNKFWNVMLYRTSQSHASDGNVETFDNMTASYYLHVGRSSGDKIRDYNVVSMSVSNPLANKAWSDTGSRSATDSGSLTVGQTFTGSLGEFKLWDNPLSASRFKQHLLDKKSNVGNSLLSAKNDLVYHYRLNENWQWDETRPRVNDANPNLGKDYSREIPASVFLTGSMLYDSTEIKRTTFALRTDGNENQNDNNIIITPNEKWISNLQPKKAARLSSFDTLEEKRTASTVVEIVRSPQDVINDFILNALGDFDINDYFAASENIEKDEYTELQNLQKDFLDHFDISLDVNKYIRAQAAIFNKSLIESIKRLLPARATLDTVGIELKDTFLNREKIAQKPKLSKEFTRPEDEIELPKPGTVTDFERPEAELDIEIPAQSEKKDYKKDIHVSSSMVGEVMDLESIPIDYRVDGTTISPKNTSPYEAIISGQDMACFPGNEFKEPSKTWGTGTGSTKFPSPEDNFIYETTWTGSGQNDRNHYEERYTFPTLGDIEVVSQSGNPQSSSADPHTTFTDSADFKNQQVTDIYSPSLGKRPIGTTAQFYHANQASASGIEAFKHGKRLDNDFIYPANHVYITGTSKDVFDNLFYKGTQNGSNPIQDNKLLEKEGQVDLNSGSFYTVNVTGENILKVNRGTKK